MKVGRVLFDVSFERDEVIVDKGRDFRVVVGLGFQPSTRASSRCRAEVNEQRFLLRLGLRERRVSILVPIHCHLFFLLF
jgi:hypothetical protein